MYSAAVAIVAQLPLQHCHIDVALPFPDVCKGDDATWLQFTKTACGIKLVKCCLMSRPVLPSQYYVTNGAMHLMYMKVNSEASRTFWYSGSVKWNNHMLCVDCG